LITVSIFVGTSVFVMKSGKKNPAVVK